MRFIALQFINPVNEVTGDFPPFPLQALGEMSAFELAFWTCRVRDYRVAGAVSCGGQTASVDFIISGDTEELSKWQTGNVFDGFGGSGPVATPPGCDAEFATLFIPGQFAHASGQDSDEGWSICAACFLDVSTYDAMGTEVAGNTLIQHNFGSQTLSAFVLKMTGFDALTGSSYERVIQLFEEVDPGGTINRPVTGIVTITPNSFFTFADEFGNPKYDAATGALMPGIGLRG